jgi:LytR cell envelope-related transcriptional attenuator
VNLGTARIVVIVALVVAGAVVLANGFPDNGEAVTSAPSSSVSPTSSPSTSPSPTEQPTETPSPQAPKDVSFMALNGTETTGAGAAAQELMTQDGYVAVPESPDDAPSKGVETTTVYYRGGQDAEQNKSDATSIADAYFQGADIKKLDTSLQDVVPDTANIVVVIGQDYADSLVQ